MKAKKDNKTYTIDESQKKFYHDAGYDIYDDTGALIAYGKGKTVPFEEYAALKAELEEAKVQTGTEDEELIRAVLVAYAAEKDVKLGNTAALSKIAAKIADKIKPPDEADAKSGSDADAQ